MNFGLFLLQAKLGESAGILQVGLLVLMVLVMYLLIIRPQQKRQKEMRKMLSQLKKGDKIVTIGGIHGKVQEIRDTIVVVCVDSETNTKVEFAKSAVSEVHNVATPVKPVESKQASIEKS